MVIMTNVHPRFGVALLALLALAALSGCGQGKALDDRPARRVLVVSLPGVAWDDVEGGAMPNLEAFAKTAAVGDLATRVGVSSADPVAAYLTIGAGTRAVTPLGDADDGQAVAAGVAVDPGVAVDAALALDATGVFGSAPASEILQRRFGTVPDGIAYMALGAARDANERSAYGADIGAVGDELAQAGVRRAVIANADEGGTLRDPPVEGAYGRAAATALMGSDGSVPEGTVSRDLLVDDGAAPFGRRLDADAVLAAFDEAWTPRGGDDRVAVLVEASDLVRTAAYRDRATPAQARDMRAAALAGADALVAGLLERVERGSDAVLVVSPVAPPGAPALGVAALRAPGVPAGLLRSATTRRDGYVQLADVGPTVLALLGEEMPGEVEGRAFRVRLADRGDRVAELVDAAEVAAFRDGMVLPVVVAFTVVLAPIGLATMWRHRLPARARASLMPLALGALGAIPATFLAGAIGPAAASLPVYAAFVVAVAVAVGGAAVAVERWFAGAGVLLALGVVIVVIAGGLVVDAPLQLNTIFGYSVAVAGRFAGLGNLAFALLGSSTVIVAALLADRFGAWGVRAGVALLAAVVIVEGLPILGADVGGVLSMVPAFGVTALVLLGRRVGWRQLVGLGAVAGGAVLVFAFVDLARPIEARTHLARLAEHVLDGRWGPFFGNLSRRWQASFGGANAAAWATMALVALAVAVYVALVATRRIGPNATPRERHRPTVAAVAGVGVLAALGLIANDSSVAVPATMLIVAVPALVHRTLLDEPPQSLTSRGGAS